MRTITVGSFLVAALVGAAFLGTPVQARKAWGSEPATRELGRRLFMDPTVSRGGQFSCASCHDPEHGFSDPRDRSVDENGPTARHSQPLVDLKDGVGMHWDGEFDKLEEILVARLATLRESTDQARELVTKHFMKAKRSRRKPDEQEFTRRINRLRPPYYGPSTPTPTTPPITLRLNYEGRYAEGFRRAFGTSEATTERLIAAMKSYVLSLKSTRNAYDRYARGDKKALSERARRGLELFQGKANCASCHSMKPSRGRVRFTDDKFHNTGVAFAGRLSDWHARAFNFKEFRLDGGRGKMSFVAKDLGKFKTPSLRDALRRPPYMHDGSLKTLKDVVDYYNRGGTKNKGLDAHVRPLRLTERETGDLVAFLESLTGEERPGLGPVARRDSEPTKIRIVGLDGKPLRGLKVSVVPFGDRLGKGPVSQRALVHFTDTQGVLKFAFPDWTHVRLEAEGYSLGTSHPLPDFVKRRKMIATPKDKTSVKIVAPKGTPEMPKRILLRSGNGNGRELGALERVHAYGADSALYVVAKGEFYERVADVWLSFQPRGARQVARSIDFRGGQSPTIHLGFQNRRIPVTVTTTKGAARLPEGAERLSRRSASRQ